jgi:hypothetical protein
MRVTVDVRKAGPFFVAGLAEKVAQTELASSLAAGARTLADEIRSVARRGRTGGLQAGVDVQGSGLDIAVREGRPYGSAIDGGRRPAPIQIRPLTLWWESKGLSAPEARRAAFALSRRRLRSSADAHPFFFATFERVAPQIQTAILGPAGAAIVSAVG